MSKCFAEYEEVVHGERYNESWCKEYEEMLKLYPDNCYGGDEVKECDGSCVRALDAMERTCLLEKGHAGPHEWTQWEDIILTKR